MLYSRPEGEKRAIRKTNAELSKINFLKRAFAKSPQNARVSRILLFGFIVETSRSTYPVGGTRRLCTIGPDVVLKPKVRYTKCIPERRVHKRIYVYVCVFRSFDVNERCEEKAELYIELRNVCVFRLLIFSRSPAVDFVVLSGKQPTTNLYVFPV